MPKEIKVSLEYVARRESRVRSGRKEGTGLLGPLAKTVLLVRRGKEVGGARKATLERRETEANLGRTDPQRHPGRRETKGAEGSRDFRESKAKKESEERESKMRGPTTCPQTLIFAVHVVFQALQVFPVPKETPDIRAAVRRRNGQLKR